MPLRKRAWLGMGGVALASAALVLGAGRLMADGEPSPAPSQAAAPAEAQTQAPGVVSQAELGNLIRAMGAEVKLDDKRFDFSFPARYAKEEWNLSMSAVLSENGNAIWVMAWLDPCPRTALEVPRTSLLKLLAKNDTLGNGKFFAYIPANNRFVLERVLPNENISTAKFREVLQDLGAAVVETYPYWSVASWKQPAGEHGGRQLSGMATKAAAPGTGAAVVPGRELIRLMFMLLPLFAREATGEPRRSRGTAFRSQGAGSPSARTMPKYRLRMASRLSRSGGAVEGSGKRGGKIVAFGKAG